MVRNKKRGKPPGPEKRNSTTQTGRRLILDPEAKSASSKLPAFLAPPPSAPAYHGFLVLEDVEIDGFKFGTITDFETEPASEGDAFVVAPDGSRAGLVWEISDSDLFKQLCRFEAGRWGVWEVTFTSPMRTREDARRNLKKILPRLREQWQMWKKKYGT